MNTEPVYVERDILLSVANCGRLHVIIEPCTVTLPTMTGLCYNVYSLSDGCLIDANNDAMFMGCGGSGKKILLGNNSVVNLTCGEKYWFIMAINSDNSNYIKN